MARGRAVDRTAHNDRAPPPGAPCGDLPPGAPGAEGPDDPAAPWHTHRPLRVPRLLKNRVARRAALEFLDATRAAHDCHRRGDRVGMGHHLYRAMRNAVRAAGKRDPPDARRRTAAAARTQATQDAQPAEPAAGRDAPPAEVGAAAQQRDPAPSPRDAAAGPALPADGAVPPQNIWRAENLVLDGQIARGAAALSSTVVPHDEALPAARKQLVDDLGALPVPDAKPAPPTQTPPSEREAWAEVLMKALPQLGRKRGVGPTGVPNELIHAVVKFAPDAVTLLADMMPSILAEPPPWMGRSRVVVTARMKASGRIKLRALCVGEALTRWVERACLVRWGKALHRAAGHSAVHLKDGALLTAAVLQGRVARGQKLLSLDARRAYDSVAHTAIVEALEAAGADPLFVRFVVASLRDREYTCGGTLVKPPVGRGTAQGTALGPLLFALVANRAATRAQQAARNALVITYLDNLYVVADTQEELAAARRAAALQWGADGMDEGDKFTVGCVLDDMEEASVGTRILGLGVNGAVPDRYERAKQLAKRAKQLSAFAELIVVRACVVPTLVYDATAADPLEDLETLENDLKDQLGERAGLPTDMRNCVFTAVRDGGLGCMPLSKVRDAHILRAGLRGLLAHENALTAALWDLAERPAGRFPVALTDLLNTAGYALNFASREVHHGGERVMRAPTSLERAALDIERGNGPRRPGGAEALPERGRSLVAVALGGECVAKQPLEDVEYQAAVRLHTGAPDPRPLGTEPADAVCPLCSRRMEPQGHHRWCVGTVGAGPKQGAQHDKLRDALVGWLGATPVIRAEAEATLLGDCAAARADAVASCPQHGSLMFEIKTVDLRAPSHVRAGDGIEKATARLMRTIAEKYAPHEPVPVIVTAAGAGTRRGALDALAQAEAMRAAVAPELADAVGLRALLGAVCASFEAESFATWWEQAAAAVGAARMANRATSQASEQAPRGAGAAVPLPPPAPPSALRRGAPAAGAGALSEERGGGSRSGCDVSAAQASAGTLGQATNARSRAEAALGPAPHCAPRSASRSQLQGASALGAQR